MRTRLDLALEAARIIDHDFSPFDLHRYIRKIDDPPPVTIDDERKYQAAAVFNKVLYGGL